MIDRRKSVGWAAAAVVYLAVAAPSYAQQNDRFRAAGIGVGPQSLGQLIRIPEQRIGEVFFSVIRCQVYIDEDGAADDFLCVRGSKADMDLRASVQEALGTAEFEPAAADGANVNVYMNLMVAFECDGTECTVNVLPHHGYQIPELGVDYVAPQAIVDDQYWDKRGWERDLSLFGYGNTGYVFFISAMIDETGRASDVKLDHIDPSWRTEGRRAMVHYERMNFIPGFYQGEVRAMRVTDFMGLHLRQFGGPR